MHIVPGHVVNVMVPSAPPPVFIVPPVPWTPLDFFLYDANQQVEAAPGGPVAWAPLVVPHQEPMMGPAVIVDEVVDPLPEGFQRCSALINVAQGILGFGLLRDSSFSLRLYLFLHQMGMSNEVSPNSALDSETDPPPHRSTTSRRHFF